MPSAMERQPIPAQDRVVGGVTEPLVVPVRVPEGALIDHAAFAHDAAGVGIAWVMAGFNA